jgi:hypothetical protein
MARVKGARNERALVSWLREHGWPDARRTLAGDGLQPGDVDAIPGVCIEVRARAECKPGSWMLDAERQAHGRLALVIYHPPGVRDPGEWIAMVRLHEIPGLLDPRV